MVRLIKKVLIPLIKKSKVVFLAMIFVSTLGVSMGTGFLSTYINFKQNSNQFFKDYGLPDVTLTLDNCYNQENIKNALKDLSYTFDYRFKYNFNGAINDYPITIEAKTINDDSFSKLFYHQQIEESPDYLNLKIHKAFADQNKLKVGDSLSFGIRTLDKMLTAKISAIVSSPESISYVLNRSIDVDKYDFAYAFVSPNEINKVLPTEMQNTINQVIVKTGDNYNEVKEKIINRLAENNIRVLDSYTRDESPSIIYIEYVYEQMQTISFVVPAIFLVITLVLVFLFLLQIIRGFMHEIGIMESLGIKKKKILGLMVAFSLSNSLISCILGTAISFALTNFMANLYQTNYSIPFVKPFPNSAIALIVSLIMIVIGGLAAWVTIFIIRNISPKDAIVNNASQFKPLPKMVDKISEKGSTNLKININNIHKNFLRFIVSVFAFASTYTIIFGAMNYYCSNEDLISKLNERSNYQVETYSIDVIPYNQQKTRNAFVSSISSLPSVKESTPSLLTSTTLSFNGHEESITLCGIKEEQSLVHIPGTTNKPCKVLPDHIVIEQEIATRFNIHINDVVKVNDCPLVVNDISLQSLSKYQYVEYDTYLTKIKPALTFDIMLVNINQKEQYLNEIIELPINLHTVFVDKYVSSTTKGFKSTQVAAISIAGFSFAVGFLIIFIMNISNLEAQRRKLSILMSLGKKKQYILKLIFEQTLINFVLGVAIGIPAGIGFAKILVKLASNTVSTMIFVNYWWIYLLALGSLLIYLVLVYFASKVIIDKWNVSNNIKTRE